MPTSLADLNACDLPRFLEVCGPLYEHSPWVAERAFARRPFASLESLHAALVQAVADAAADEQLALIRSHPDLVGRLAREGRLTAASTGEQAAAGLDALSESEVDAFERFNREYRDRFGFPFVICARENRKDAILAAFPVRLGHTAEQERATALAEIGKIGRLRLLDAVSEP
ncbi:MAG: 2-oxo-4-hydroxy-4-carboxy-5-ureidoimidazoline decarboxylase [Planctomycetes bacterium]|nr:2-oxo-4-hydroxy-4-carboxy-5-ureidoimidazoline decarboxylase [Planctomycetota bacterium]